METGAMVVDDDVVELTPPLGISCDGRMVVDEGVSPSEGRDPVHPATRARATTRPVRPAATLERAGIEGCGTGGTVVAPVAAPTAFAHLTNQSIESRPMEINGISAIITGGASGLGEATSRHLASLGAKVVVADLDRQQEKGEALAKELASLANFSREQLKQARADKFLAIGRKLEEKR
mgnify:CR=1 FL=1